MTYRSETLDWLLKASLWIAANESLEDTFEAIREAKNAIRQAQTVDAEEPKRSSIVHRLLECEVWTASGSRLDDVASNFIELFNRFQPSDFDLENGSEYFGETLFDCRVNPTDDLSEFWNIRIDSAKERGAADAQHTLLDFALKTIEVGVHPITPEPVSFIVGDFSEEQNVEDPDIRFPVEIHHRSARVMIESDQVESIHEKVVWIDDSTGRMGVVGGEPLPVIGQPEGHEPALRVNSDGEQVLQPFDSITMHDEDESIHD